MILRLLTHRRNQVKLSCYGVGLLTTRQVDRRGRCNQRMRTRTNCWIFELMLENSPWSPQRSSETSPNTLPSPGRSQKSWPGPPLHTNTAHLSTYLWKHLCPSECHIYCVWLRMTRLTLHGGIDVAPVGEDNVHIVQLQPGERASQACNTHAQHRGIRCNNWINVGFIFSGEGQTKTHCSCPLVMSLVDFWASQRFSFHPPASQLRDHYTKYTPVHTLNRHWCALNKNRKRFHLTGSISYSLF